MKWYENLPPDCPPETAEIPQASYFRLGSIPPEESDFWSHRRRFPHKKFHVSECVAQSLSIFDDFEADERLKRLLPAMRSKPIYQVDLTEGDGWVLQTGQDPHHFSWWRSTDFEISNIKIVKI
jgi:hypothetical protein